MNHIVIDYNIINKSNYVRIVPINSSTEYNIEINKLYPDTNTNIGIGANKFNQDIGRLGANKILFIL